MDQQENKPRTNHNPGEMISKDRYFMNLAWNSAMWANCTKWHIGTVLVQGTNVISIGYNTAIDPNVSCEELGCLLRTSGQEGKKECNRTIHAELKAILNAATLGISTKGAICYCTVRPCHRCYLALIGAGVSEVVYDIEHGNDVENKELGIDNLIRSRKI